MKLTTTQEKILQTVSSESGLTRVQFAMKSREPKFVKWRQLLCYVLSIYGNMSCVGIGKNIIKRDHSTVVYSRKMVANILSIATDRYHADYVKIVDRCKVIAGMPDVNIMKQLQKSGCSIMAIVGVSYNKTESK